MDLEGVGTVELQGMIAQYRALIEGSDDTLAVRLVQDITDELEAALERLLRGIRNPEKE